MAPTVRPSSAACRAPSRAPPISSAAWTTTVIALSAAMIRLRAGNIHRHGSTPGGSSDRRLLGRGSARTAALARPIGPVGGAGEHRDRTSAPAPPPSGALAARGSGRRAAVAGRHRAAIRDAMCAAPVDPQRHPADDRHAGAGQPDASDARAPRPIRRRAPGPDDRDRPARRERRQPPRQPATYNAAGGAGSSSSAPGQSTERSDKRHRARPRATARPARSPSTARASAHASARSPADHIDQLIVRQRQQLIDPRALGLKVAGEQLQRRPRADTGRRRLTRDIAASDSVRCRRLSASSTSARRIRSRPSRSAIVCATRMTRWRPRALNAPALVRATELRPSVVLTRRWRSARHLPVAPAPLSRSRGAGADVPRRPGPACRELVRRRQRNSASLAVGRRRADRSGPAAGRSAAPMTAEFQLTAVAAITDAGVATWTWVGCRDQHEPGREQERRWPRTITTPPSSSGWRSESNAGRWNSDSSSRNRTPCGRAWPRPAAAASRRRSSRPGDRVVWRAEWPRVISPSAWSPATLCSRVTSIASARLSVGRIDGSRRASIVLPVPGAPSISRLCPPAAAISSASNGISWPRTSARSGSRDRRRRTGLRPGIAGIGRPRSTPAASVRLRTGTIWSPPTSAASRARWRGTNSRAQPARRAPSATASMPGESRSSPPSDSSPNTAICPSARQEPAPRRPTAPARSRHRTRDRPCAATPARGWR